jgi:hypothetical protein
MSAKLNIYTNKTLKLSNALVRHIGNDEHSEFEKIVEFMEHYIKSKLGFAHNPI